MNVSNRGIMKKLSFKILPTLSLLLLFTSCGNDGGTSRSGKIEDSTPGEVREETPDAQVEEQEPQEEGQVSLPLDGSNIDGTYTARFVTLNPQVNGTIPGSATFMRSDDKWFAYVRLFAGMPKAWHMQHVYVGDRCPTLGDDLNKDGFIDIVEAEAVLGKILIPLDSDISSQNSGRRFFPLADPSGSYHYERVTSFRRFFDDLKSPDKDPNDNYVKLAPHEGLAIEGKAVLIQGISEDVELPETIASVDRRKPFQTFPIACGIFEKVTEIAGTPHNDEDPIPGPIADVIEGQDRPAPDDEDEDSTSEGSGSENDTNDSDDGNGPVSDGEGRRPDGTTSGSGSGGSSGTGSGSGSSSGAGSGSSSDSGSGSGSSSDPGSGPEIGSDHETPERNPPEPNEPNEPNEPDEDDDDDADEDDDSDSEESETGPSPEA